jgi:hypothetical protein
MAMRQHDSLERLRPQPQTPEQPAQVMHFAGQARVQQDALVAIMQKVAAAHNPADRK